MSDLIEVSGIRKIEKRMRIVAFVCSCENWNLFDLTFDKGQRFFLPVLIMVAMVNAFK